MEKSQSKADSEIRMSHFADFRLRSILDKKNID